MRKYETIVVIHPELSEEKVLDELKRVENILKAHQASDVVIDRWGKKEIAYKVGKHKVGNFICLKYTAGDHNVITELSSSLRISDGVIKFQNHRINEHQRKFKGNTKRRPAGDGMDDDMDTAEGFF